MKITGNRFIQFRSCSSIRHAIFCIGAAFILLSGCASKQQAASDWSSVLTPMQPEGFRGPLFTGELKVASDPSDSEGKKIPVFVAISPALQAGSDKPPIFMLNGGPGLAATDWVDFFHNIDTRYRQNHDIVYVDIRGTGRSGALHCTQLQRQDGIHQIFSNEYPKSEVIDCANKLSQQVNLADYRTSFVVEDIEQIRQWLGYNTINLYGVSAGGKISIEYMRRYPNQIGRAVLHAPAIGWQPSLKKRSNRGLEALQLLFENCRVDVECQQAFGDIEAKYRRLENRIKQEPIALPGSQNQESGLPLQLNWQQIGNKLFTMLYTDDKFIRIPYIIAAAADNNYQPLFDEFSPPQQASKFPLGVYFTMLCGEDIPLSDNVISSDSYGLFGDYVFQSRLQACQHWPVADYRNDFSQDFRVDVPVMIVLGGLDPVIPNDTAEILQQNFPNSRSVVIPKMGHMFIQMENVDSCYDRVLVEFYNGEASKADEGCFKHMTHQPFVGAGEN